MKTYVSMLAIFLIGLQLVIAKSNPISVDSKTFIKYSTCKTEAAINHKSDKIQVSETNNEDYPVLLLSNLKGIFNSGNSAIRINDFPVSLTENKNIVINAANPVFDENTQWLAGTSDGLMPVSAPEMYSYQGFIAGEQDSKVYINVSGNMMYSLIQHSDGSQYSITPSKNQFDSKDYTTHLLSSPDNSFGADEHPFICGTPEYSGHMTEEIDLYKNKGDQPLRTNLLNVPLAIEGTYDYYQLLGSDETRALLYIASVIAQSARIYEENINVTFYISTVILWEEQAKDPYRNTSTLSDKLSIMPSVWNGRAATRAIGVLFASLYNQPQGEIVAGISYGGTPYKGSLCNYSQGYCCLGIKADGGYPTTNYTWDVNCATHEMGHNFSGPHTHNCYWKPNMIDTCITKYKPYTSDGCVTCGNPIPRPGTIMSYCHLTNSTHNVVLKFHDRMKPLLRRAAESASCCKDMSAKYVHLLNPLGGVTLKVGETEPIRWTSAITTKVNLRYSSDGGNKWNEIASNLPVKDSIYQWKIPYMYTTKALVMICDADLPVVSDTSIVNFSVFPVVLNLINPVGGESFGHLETVEITWNKVFVNNVKIELSTDGGKTWTFVIGGLDLTSYQWQVPQIQEANCKIRVVDESDNSIISESGVFGIGKETAELFYPYQGLKLCIGKTYSINWESEYISKVFLMYSTDSGTSWRKVRILPLNGSDKYYDWTIPKMNPCNNVIMSLVSAANLDLIITQIEGTFAIDSCLTSVGNEEIESPLLRISDIIPNSASNQVTVTIQNNMADNLDVELALTNELGSTFQIKQNLSNLALGSNTIKLDISQLAQGSYYLVVKAGKLQTSAALKIVR
ncbi:MAG: Peptidase protein [Bacteroidota bacterium]|nr:Peptidase protein [Bacteroidota bacterium]